MSGMSFVSELIDEAIDKAVSRAIERDESEVDPADVVEIVLNSLRVDQYEDALRYLLRSPIVIKFRNRRDSLGRDDYADDEPKPKKVNNQNRRRFYEHRRLLRILETTYAVEGNFQKFFKDMTKDDLDFVINREMIQGKGAIRRAIHLKRVRSAISDYETVGKASDAGAVDLVTMMDDLDNIDVNIIDSLT